MITDAIESAFSRAKSEKWWKLYVAVDVHGVLFESTSKTERQRIFLPGAIDALRYLSGRKDVDLILFTCSWPEEVEEILSLCKKHGIFFTRTYQNTEVENDARGYYDYKPYYNVLLDDKAGFVPSDWGIVKKTFEKYPELASREEHTLSVLGIREKPVRASRATVSWG